MSIFFAKYKLFVLSTAALLGLSAAAQATPILALAGDTGTRRTENFNAGNGLVGLSSSPVTNPYGAPPLPAVVTLTPNTVWQATFSLNSFTAQANNGTGPNGQSVQMDGNLAFYITLDSAAPLTVNINEAGTESVTGDGTFGVTGGLVVSAVNSNLIAVETHSNSFPAPALNGGNWTLFDQVGGFSGPYVTYKVSIDNTLLAQALSNVAAGTATITKTQFSITFTTDGSSGGGQPSPEPASLGLLALGALSLLTRRRKA